MAALRFFWQRLLGLRILRLRYSLRALLVLVTLFMLWGGYHANRAIKEKNAERMLLFHGRAELICGPKTTPAPLLTYIDALLSHYIWGERYINQVVIAPNLTQSEIEALASLPHLDRLYIDSTQSRLGSQSGASSHHVASRGDRLTIPNGAISYILTHRTLSHLSITGTTVGKDDLSAISQHQSLEHVLFSHTNLDGHTFSELLRLPRLKRIDLRAADLTPSSLSRFNGSKTLRELWLTGSSSANALDEGLADFLSHSDKIEVLVLCSHSVDDAFLQRLGTPRSLNALTVISNNVSASCLNDIAKITTLRTLVLPETALKTSDRRKLGSRLPCVSITAIPNDLVSP